MRVLSAVKKVTAVIVLFPKTCLWIRASFLANYFVTAVITIFISANVEDHNSCIFHANYRVAVCVHSVAAVYIFSHVYTQSRKPSFAAYRVMS